MSSISSYTADNKTNPNAYVARVNVNGQKDGPNILLKGMSGDMIQLAVQSFYNTNTVRTNNNSFTHVLNFLANGLLITPAGGRSNLDFLI